MEKNAPLFLSPGCQSFHVFFVEGLPTVEFMPQGGKLRVLTDGR